MYTPENYQKFYEAKFGEFFKLHFEDKDLNKAVFETYKDTIIKILAAQNRISLMYDSFGIIMDNKSLYRKLSDDNKKKLKDYHALFEVLISKYQEIVDFISEYA